MARPKSSTNKPKATKAKKQAPASTPETTDLKPKRTVTYEQTEQGDVAVFNPPFSEPEVSAGGPLEEGVTPAPKKIPKGNEGPCQSCVHTSHTKVALPHDGSLHYGSPERWCNAAGCRCQAYRP